MIKKVFFKSVMERWDYRTAMAKVRQGSQVARPDWPVNQYLIQDGGKIVVRGSTPGEYKPSETDIAATDWMPID